MKKNKQKKNLNNNEWEGCDDCAICKAMKNGTASNYSESIKAFKEAEKKGNGKAYNTEPADNAGFHMTMRTENKDDLYYDAMDLIGEGDYKMAEKLLKKALEIDDGYVQTYIGFAHMYGAMKEKKLAHKNIEIAFDKTKKEFPKWPKKMEWGVLDNRAYLRAIQYKAEILFDDNKIDEAVLLYRLLLKLNPNDNQGVRYVLAGMYAGIKGDEINKMFDEGNKNQNWDKLENLVEKQNKKHSFWKEPKY